MLLLLLYIILLRFSFFLRKIPLASSSFFKIISKLIACDLFRYVVIDFFTGGQGRITVIFYDQTSSYRMAISRWRPRSVINTLTRVNTCIYYTTQRDIRQELYESPGTVSPCHVFFFCFLSKMYSNKYLFGLSAFKVTPNNRHTFGWQARPRRLVKSGDIVVARANWFKLCAAIQFNPRNYIHARCGPGARLRVGENTYIYI